MAFGKILKLSALAAAMSLAGCGGGDIVINPGSSSGSTPSNPANPSNPTPPPATSVCPSFAKQGSSLGGVNKPICEITGTLTADATLTANIAWALNGKVTVGNDNANSATLNIEPGTTIFGKSGADFLVIARGSKIRAVGSSSNPIVFTSVNDMIGSVTEDSTAQWGGLVILGKAPSNKCDQAALATCKIEAEGNAGPYGGDKPDDNSGILKFVQVKYAGYEVLTDNELNGITFAGVGSGTVVEYIQVHNNLDDGVEFFGGTVNAKYVVLTGNRDDSLDWADGWTGKMQHVLIRHSKNDTKANRAIEADNQSGNFSATPVSKPKIANMTIIGNNYKSADADSEGILLRAGTAGELYNVIVTGPSGMGECLEIETAQSIQQAQSGGLLMRNSIIGCAEPFRSPRDSAGNTLLDVRKWFLDQTGNRIGDPLLGGYTPASTSPALKNGYNVSNFVDPWFDDVDYIGAFNGISDWTRGWTFGLHPASAIASCPTGTSEIASLTGKLNCELKGDLTSNVTLLAGADYVLNGRVRVGVDNTTPATLTVQPGVTVYGRSGADFLVVTRGSKIHAEGTQQNPITFTSLQDVIGSATAPGQWGGIVLLGNAPSNKCDQANLAACRIEAEGNAGPYGGANLNDNSGVLKYVRVKHAGYEVLQDNELNGITFAGVGAGTTVSHIQVHQNLDDGIEFFGGSVNAKYVVLTSNGDDSLDWADGWNGKIQYILVKHGADNSEANRGIEADNQSGNFSAAPISNPTIANMTIIGNNYKSAEKDSEGVLLRAGTNAQLHNFIITGSDGMGECLEIETNESRAFAASGSMKMTHSTIACTEPFRGTVSPTMTVKQWFEGQEGNKTAANQAAVLNGVFTIDTNVPRDMSTVNSFFSKPTSIGAVDAANDWTKGWTIGLN